MEKVLLTKAEISDAKKISDTSWINPSLVYRPISTILKSIRSGRILVLKNNTKTIGWIEMYAITKTVYGISTLYISPEFRGHSFHKILIRAAVQKLSQVNILVATSNPRIKQFLLQHRFIKIPFTSLPPYIILSLIYFRYFNIFSIWKYCTSAGKHIDFLYRV